jgi:hypothetical protein
MRDKSPHGSPHFISTFACFTAHRIIQFLPTKSTDLHIALFWQFPDLDIAKLHLGWLGLVIGNEANGPAGE